MTSFITWLSLSLSRSFLIYRVLLVAAVILSSREIPTGHTCTGKLLASAVGTTRSATDESASGVNIIYIYTCRYVPRVCCQVSYHRAGELGVRRTGNGLIELHRVRTSTPHTFVIFYNVAYNFFSLFFCFFFSTPLPTVWFVSSYKNLITACDVYHNIIPTLIFFFRN